MDCKRITEELVFLVLDDEMGQEQLTAYETHVSRCPHCAQRVQMVRRVVTLIRQKSLRCSAPMSLRQKILARMQSTS